MNHIAGPSDGKYVAAFTVPEGAEHRAFAKVTRIKPSHVWDGTPGSRWISSGPYLESVTAMAIVIDLATKAIDVLGDDPGGCQLRGVQ